MDRTDPETGQDPPGAEMAAQAVARRPEVSLIQVIQKAKQTVSELTGLPVDAVSSCSREGDVWTASVDVIESRARLGDNDMLATYEVAIDPFGEVSGFSRTERYNRTDAAGRR